MIYEGINFDSKWVASQTLAEFMEHEKHHGLTKEQMKEAWELAKVEKKELTKIEKAEAADEPSNVVIVGKANKEK